MLTLLFSLSMAQMAHMEKRRPLVWGLLTFLISALVQTYLISGYWGAVVGFFISFGAMIYAKTKHPVNMGPTVSNSPRHIDK